MKKVLIGIAAVIVLFFILFLTIACKEYIEVKRFLMCYISRAVVDQALFCASNEENGSHAFLRQIIIHLCIT